MKLIKISALLFFSFIATSYALQNVLQTTALNKPIIVGKQANYFTIHLNSNPSTGYSWRVKSYDANVVVPIKQTFSHPKVPMPGAGGIESFSFRVNHNAFKVEGLTQVTFVYIRPWNLQVAKSVTFTIVSE